MLMSLHICMYVSTDLAGGDGSQESMLVRTADVCKTQAINIQGKCAWENSDLNSAWMCDSECVDIWLNQLLE